MPCVQRSPVEVEKETTSTLGSIQPAASQLGLAAIDGKEVGAVPPLIEEASVVLKA